MSDKDPLSGFFEILEGYGLNDIMASALRFAFRNPYESIAVVDKEMKIQFMDKPSERFFGLEPGGAKGRDMREFMPNSSIPKVLKEGVPLIGRIWEGKGVKRVGSIYPLKKNGQIIGAIAKILFHSLDEVERINNEIRQLKTEVSYLKQKERTEQSSLYTFNDILGNSRLIRETIERAKKIASLNTDVLLLGESGTGKELFAHSIHSFRNPDTPFIKVNCAAIPFELAESHLFGYEKGAFTGAVSVGKPGVFEAAQGGTVFLDEISSLPLSIQAKLLRVLQEREVTRLGSTKTKKIEFRSIAATNIDLLKLMREGTFRHDLYYRIAETRINIPPLRERREDIPLYLSTFLEKINKVFNTSIQGITDEALSVLCQYSWPGNVREMINALEQIAINVWENEPIKIRHLPDTVRQREPYGPSETGEAGPIAPATKSDGIRHQVTTMEKEMIINALKETGGNSARAARLLKMPRSTFYKKLGVYKIGK